MTFNGDIRPRRRAGAIRRSRSRYRWGATTGPGLWWTVDGMASNGVTFTVPPSSTTDAGKVTGRACRKPSGDGDADGERAQRVRAGGGTWQ